MTALTVLVVDDTDVVRWLVSRQLREAGYEALEAASGAEALLILGAPGVRVDLIITDMKMPPMGGKELVDAVAHVLPPPRVLFMSAYPPPKGVEGYSLQKPFTREQLITAVQEVLAT